MWKVSIGKCMIFSCWKGSREYQCKFMLNVKDLEAAKEFTYLDATFGKDDSERAESESRKVQG